jgi:hypothetical protein
MTHAAVRSLSARYGDAFAELLAKAGSTPNVRPDALAVFWPMTGASYQGDLLVVGRAVNGWIDKVSVAELVDATRARAWAETARYTAEDDEGDPMGWVARIWDRQPGYRTSRSALWRVTRAVHASLDPASVDDPRWSTRIAWSNLAKLAPWNGGNPGGALLALQREIGPALLAREVDELAPKRIVVFTGRWWFEPFATALSLDVTWHHGLVVGTATDGDRQWVIAEHPMTRPQAPMVAAVVSAFIP